MPSRLNIFKKNGYLYPILTLALCHLSFVFLGKTGAFMHTSIGQTQFLAIHILLEFLSILFSFAIFTLVFYIYRQNSRLRYLVLACVFFIGGFLDIFHTMSFKGMPDFFVPNGASIPTTYWVIARSIMAVGFLWAACIRPDRTARISRWIVLVLSLSVSLMLFYIVTFKTHLLPEFYIEGQGLTPLKVRAEYAIIVLQAAAVALSVREYRRTASEASILFATALIISIYSELCFTLYISVFDMYNLMGHVFKIIAYSVMFNILFVQNIRLPYERLEKADEMLKKHARTLEQEVQKARLEIMETNNQLYKDIELAREIQQSMLPSQKLGYRGIEFLTTLIPCKSLSGDFYNVFRIDEDNTGFYLTDVSGHGISSSIITIFADRTILSNRLDTQRKGMLLSPSMVLNDLFIQFNNSRFPNEMYLLMFYGVYNNRTRELTYSSAGLNTQPIVLSGGRVHTLKIKDPFPICKMGEYHRPEYRDNILPLKAGDRILLYSDGLVEAVNREGEAFSEKRLMEILERNKQANARDLYYEIFDRFSCFVLDRKLEDDVTILVANIL
jgi:sigma-B regulation protein RsbU (phosphoserine phosphatase)